MFEGAQVSKSMTFETHVLTKFQHNNPTCFPRPASWPQVGGKDQNRRLCRSCCHMKFCTAFQSVGPHSCLTQWCWGTWMMHPGSNFGSMFQSCHHGKITLHWRTIPYHGTSWWEWPFTLMVLLSTETTNILFTVSPLSLDPCMASTKMCSLRRFHFVSFQNVSWRGNKLLICWHGFTGLCYLSPFLSCSCPSSSEVRAEANRIVADVISWSMKISTSGIGPPTGFYNEVFKESTYRAKLCGAKLAKGWRPHSYERVHLLKFWGVPWKYLFYDLEIALLF